MVALLIITILSVAVAVVMSIVAWRIAREERRRSDARVEALADEIYADELPLVPPGDYLPSEAPPRIQRNFLGALAVGVLFVGTVVGLAIIFSDGARDAAVTAPAAGAEAEARDAGALELLALSNERAGDRLIVRGIVRAQGLAGAGPIVAVVSAFDRDGGLVASARSPLERAAGIESNFAVTMAGADALQRYRVSFRRDDRVIAHVDRRNQAHTAQLP